VTGLDLADLIKEELQREHEIISRHMRRRAILEHYARRLRLGVNPTVVRAEIEAAGESLTLPDGEIA
jgi:hypothetical protein